MTRRTGRRRHHPGGGLASSDRSPDPAGRADTRAHIYTIRYITRWTAYVIPLRFSGMTGGTSEQRSSTRAVVCCTRAQRQRGHPRKGFLDASEQPSHAVQRFARAALAGATLLAIIGAAQPAAAGQPAVAAQRQHASPAALAGATAIASVDLAGTWSFTPTGRAATSITVPGGGWYKQGFTDVTEAVYSRTITVPDSGQPQSAWIEFGAVNHQATLSVDGRVVATQTTAFTPSNFDITAYAAPGTTHTISVNVKGRGALKAANGRYLVPDAADWSEAVPQGIFGSAFLRVYPAVYVSDTFVRTSVANKTLTYDVSVRNTSGSSRSVTLTGSLSSDNGTAFSYPALPSRTVTVAARSTATVTVGPVAWNLDSTSYWWPNVPYRSGYRAQLHRLAVHAVTDDGRTSDATYRFGFREATQNGEYYYLNGVRANFRGDNLQGADYDRVNNGGKGDAYDTLPGFLPPSSGNGGWPQAVDNYQRLNYNVVRIHQEPASPYMLDVADEMGLMIIDETAIRGSCSLQDFGSPGTTTWSTTPVRWSCATATTPRSSAGARATSRTRAARTPSSSRRTCTRR